MSRFGPDDMKIRLSPVRGCDGCVITSARFAPPQGDADALHARIGRQLRKRDGNTTTKDRSAG